MASASCDVVHPDRASSVLETLRALESDFYASDARVLAADLVVMGDRAADRFRAKHPEVSEQGVSALRWAYTYDHK